MWTVYLAVPSLWYSRFAQSSNQGWSIGHQEERCQGSQNVDWRGWAHGRFFCYSFLWQHWLIVEAVNGGDYDNPTSSQLDDRRPKLIHWFYYLMAIRPITAPNPLIMWGKSMMFVPLTFAARVPAGFRSHLLNDGCNMCAPMVIKAQELHCSIINHVS